MRYNVRKEWLVDENGEIVTKPLSFWFNYFDIEIAEVETFFHVKTLEDLYKVNKNADQAGRYIDIYNNRGCKINPRDVHNFMDCNFYVGNADIGGQLRMCR